MTSIITQQGVLDSIRRRKRHEGLRRCPPTHSAAAMDRHDHSGSVAVATSAVTVVELANTSSTAEQKKNLRERHKSR